MTRKKRIGRKIWIFILSVLIIQILFDPLSSFWHVSERLQARVFLPIARRKWKSHGSTHYQFEIQGYVPLVCMFGGGIEVKDGVVIPRLRSAGGDPSALLFPGFSGVEDPSLCNYQNYTVSLLFDEIERQLDQAPISITQISFDPTYGFVSSLRLGNPEGQGLLNPTISDCCGGFSIDNFEILNK